MRVFLEEVSAGGCFWVRLPGRAVGSRKLAELFAVINLSCLSLSIQGAATTDEG